MGRITKVTANPAKHIREGLWPHGDGKKQFTVKLGTVFEPMRLPLHKALLAAYLMTSSKKGISLTSCTASLRSLRARFRS